MPPPPLDKENVSIIGTNDGNKIYYINPTKVTIFENFSKTLTTHYNKYNIGDLCKLVDIQEEHLQQYVFTYGFAPIYPTDKDIILMDTINKVTTDIRSIGLVKPDVVVIDQTFFIKETILKITNTNITFTLYNSEIYKYNITFNYNINKDITAKDTLWVSHFILLFTNLYSVNAGHLLVYNANVYIFDSIATKGNGKYIINYRYYDPITNKQNYFYIFMDKTSKLIMFTDDLELLKTKFN